MNDFKEWLSDNLRYFLLGIAILVVFAVAVIGIRIYSKVTGPSKPEAPVTESNPVTTEGTEKLTEKTTEKPSEKTTEKESETKEESESETEEETEPESGQTESQNLPEYVTVSTDLNLRDAPSSETGVLLGTYGQGRVAKVLGEKDGWYQVRIGGQTGYMSAAYLSPTEYEEGMEQEVETNPPEPETEPTVVVQSSATPQSTSLTLKATCYLRAGTSKQSDILDTIMAGTTVEFLGEEAGWYKVSVNGMTGYMGPQFF